MRSKGESQRKGQWYIHAVLRPVMLHAKPSSFSTFGGIRISMLLVLVMVLCMHHNHNHVPPSIPPFANIFTRTSDLENSWKKLIHAYPERLCPATRSFLKKELKLKFDFLSASLSLTGSIDGKIIYIFTKTKWWRSVSRRRRSCWSRQHGLMIASVSLSSHAKFHFASIARSGRRQLKEVCM